MRGRKRQGGFTLIEAVLSMMLIGVAFFSFGYLFGNIEQEALTTDLTVIATRLARERMEELMQEKADSGYASVASEGAASVASGTWNFTRTVTVQYVNPADLSNSVIDTGYKRVAVNVAWSAGSGNDITLTTLMTDMVPADVEGIGYPACP